MKYNEDTLFENLKEVTAIMKKLLTLMLLVSLCLSGCALGNNVSEGENAMTISDFKKDTSLTSIPGNSSNLTNLDLEPVIAYGRLRALFGEPNYETQNFEDAYSYILFVEPESSEKIYLEVYEGSSGPAIGGLNNAESLQAAETLKKLIEESEEVADYQYEGYYLDLDSKITMGIKNGVPYCNEEFCEEIPDSQSLKEIIIIEKSRKSEKRSPAFFAPKIEYEIL